MEYLRNDELLSAYLDRELSPDERAAVDRLLESSPEARDRLRELEGISRFVRRMPRLNLEPDFTDTVLDRLRNESLLRPPVIEPVRRSHRLNWRISGPLAAAAMLLVAVWAIRKPGRVVGPLADNTQNSIAAVRSVAADSDAAVSDSEAVDRWEQLKVGDFFNVVGPEGESPFQLIVVGKESDADPIRCVLVDRGNEPDEAIAGKRNEPAIDSPTVGPTLALQADRTQLDLLAKAYAHSNSTVAEPFAVVDIYAQLDRLTLDGIRAHSHSVPSGAVPAEARKAEALSGSPIAAKPPASGGQANDNPPSSEGSRMADGVVGESAENRVVMTIKRVEMQSSPGVPGASAGATDDSARKTSRSVGDLVKSDDRRPIPSNGRVEVLLRFKDSTDSEKSNR
jgi:hypothetical protein